MLIRPSYVLVHFPTASYITQSYFTFYMLSLSLANLAYQVPQVGIIFELGQKLIDGYMLFVKSVILFQIGIRIFEVLAAKDFRLLYFFEFVKEL